MVSRLERLAKSVGDDAVAADDQARRRTFMHAQQVCSLSTEAIDILFEASGTSATQIGQDMERIYRDMAMIRTHYMMDHERTSENWGAVALGLDACSPN